MEAKSIIIGILIGILMGAIGMRTYLHRWIKNNVIYPPGTGKIWKEEYVSNLTYPVNKFLKQNIPHRFYRYLGEEVIREPYKDSIYRYKVEYWE